MPRFGGAFQSAILPKLSQRNNIVVGESQENPALGSTGFKEFNFNGYG
jgi:hypothetical protein